MSIAAWADEPVSGRPWASSAYDLEVGVLREIGSGTTFDYRLVPVQLSWRSKEFMGHAYPDGSRVRPYHVSNRESFRFLVALDADNHNLRNRFSALARRFFSCNVQLP